MSPNIETSRTRASALAALRGETIGSLIAGKTVEGKGEPIALTDPATGYEITSYRDAGPEVVDFACTTAVRGAIEWRRLTAQRRAEILNRASVLLRERTSDLARLEALTAGKPLRDARAEVGKVGEMFAYYAGWCDKVHGEAIPLPSTHLNYTQHVPYGVVAQITPWNAPIFTAGWQLAPALAAGNAVILKPSELTPLTSLALGRILIEAGVPASAVTILVGLGRSTGAALVVDSRVRKVVFVGSVAAGKAVAELCASQPKPCVLELGGKSANLVFDDADLERAAAGAAAAIFASAGQSCVAGSRLLVHRPIYEHLLDKLAAITRSIRIGDPLEEQTQLGPINNGAQLEKIIGLVRAGVEQGAELACGGRRSVIVGQEAGFYFEPTILRARDASPTIVREEVFGPVVVAIPFDNEDHAVALANDSEFGLAGAVWSRDAARAHRVAARIEAGTVWINSYKSLSVMSPFGGFKSSGYGKSSGREGLLEYLQVRSVWVETAAQPKFQFDPPGA